MCVVQARSLLTAHEDFTTLMFTSPTEIQRPGLVFSFLKKYMPSEDTVEEVKRMSLTSDGRSAVFDVPSKLAQVGCQSESALHCPCHCLATYSLTADSKIAAAFDVVLKACTDSCEVLTALMSISIRVQF